MRVLVVDDEADASALVKRALQDVSADVATAASGQAALRIQEEHAFDVMVFDISMPGMDGYGLIERIRDGFLLLRLLLSDSPFPFPKCPTG